MTFRTQYEGRKYVYTEFGKRARITNEGLTVWWGEPRALIPTEAVPIAVLLDFSMMRANASNSSR